MESLAAGQVGRQAGCRPRERVLFVLTGSAKAVAPLARTIAGYDVMHMLRTGQVRDVGTGDIPSQARCIEQLFCNAAASDMEQRQIDPMTIVRQLLQHNRLTLIPTQQPGSHGATVVEGCAPRSPVRLAVS